MIARKLFSKHNHFEASDELQGHVLNIEIKDFNNVPLERHSYSLGLEISPDRLRTNLAGEEAGQSEDADQDDAAQEAPDDEPDPGVSGVPDGPRPLAPQVLFAQRHAAGARARAGDAGHVAPKPHGARREVQLVILKGRLSAVANFGNKPVTGNLE